VLVRDGGGYCPSHKREVKKQIEERRESSTKRGYGYKWQQARAQFLRRHPLCECKECQAGAIRLMAATEVDHIIPHKLDDAIKSGDLEQIAKAQALFWDRKNWQAMSKSCHSKKTAREDGGWGRG
jgi:5-methylcytosine-specific restriction protein A